MPRRRSRRQRVYDSMNSDNLITPDASPSEYPDMPPEDHEADYVEEEPVRPKKRRSRKSRGKGKKSSFTPDDTPPTTKARSPKRKSKKARRRKTASRTPASPLVTDEDVANISEGDLHKVDFGRKIQKVVGSTVRKSIKTISENPTTAGVATAGALIGAAALYKHGTSGARKALGKITGADKEMQEGLEVANEVLKTYNAIPKGIWAKLFGGGDIPPLDTFSPSTDKVMRYARTYLLAACVRTHYGGGGSKVVVPPIQLAQILPLSGDAFARATENGDDAKENEMGRRTNQAIKNRDDPAFQRFKDMLDAIKDRNYDVSQIWTE